MWPFRKREIPPPEPQNFEGMAALGEAFARSFAAQIEGNAKIAGIFSNFISEMGDLSIRQAARAMGQRSASKRERNPKGKFLAKKKAQCALCDDPWTRNVSVELIKAHRGHEAGAEILPSGVTPADANGGPEIPPELN